MGGGLERSGWDKQRGVDMDTDAQLLWFVVVGINTHAMLMSCIDYISVARAANIVQCLY